MDGRPPFVDAHLHLWDRGRLHYAWLDQPGNAPIADSYALADYRAETAAWNLAGAVHVEAAAAFDEDRAETDWLNGLADEDGLPSGIVAHVPLHHDDAERKIAWQAAQPRVVGVRHIVNWHFDPVRCAYPGDLTLDPVWRRHYALLARYGLSYDFHGFAPQLAALAQVAAQNDGVPLVVNHLALPVPADGLDEWRAGITALAALPHVAIKLSGAGFTHTPFDPAGFAPLVREVIDRFGTARVMVGSNFPTDRLFATMDRTLGAYEQLLAGCSDDERRDLWGRNANRLYRLGLPL